jgi:hypothetical protein
VEALARPCAVRNPSGWTYSRRAPEKTALYEVLQEHLPRFDRMWTDTESGSCLPRHVSEELKQFLTCGILAFGFAQLHCEACRKRHLVAFSCKGHGFCPSCLGRRMNEGAANLVDHVHPAQVPLRQWVITLPHPVRYPLAFDARIFLFLGGGFCLPEFFLCGGIAWNVDPSLKWLGRECTIGEDASGWGTITPGASARS